jgi:hypothetical protein
MNSKMYQMMLMYAMAGAMLSDPVGSNYKEQLSPEELAEIERIRKLKALEIKEKKGLKYFIIDGIGIYALNHKNAMRKVSKLKNRKIS